MTKPAHINNTQRTTQLPGPGPAGMSPGSHAVVMGVVVLMVVALPGLWGKWEKFNPAPSFRIPYSLSQDYWLFARWAGHAAGRYPAVVLGDSFIWGEYADATDVLSQCLNRALGRDCFANLGLNGLHPAAAQGLVEHEAKSISAMGVLMYFNPLWVQSPQLDLSAPATDENFRPQHPKLLAQFSSSLRSCTADVADRLGAVAGRYLPLLRLRDHIKLVYLDGSNPMEWVVRRPYQNPFASRDALARFVRKSSRAHSEPRPWTDHGAVQLDAPWVPLADSYQWRCFNRAIEVLNSRHNRVLILLGTCNPHMLTPQSRARYEQLRAELAERLRSERKAFWVVPDLPSAYYTDASHVAAEGYARIADDMLRDDGFRAWLAALAKTGGR